MFNDQEVQIKTDIAQFSRHSYDMNSGELNYPAMFQRIDNNIKGKKMC